MAKRRGVRRSVLFSLAVHALPLFVLGGVLAHQAAPRRGEASPRISSILATEEGRTPDLPDAPLEVVRPREVPLDLPAARLPDPEPLADEPLPLEPLPTEEPAWRVEEIPLRVARRRLGASRPSSKEKPRGKRPLHLKPVHAPQYYPERAVRLGLEGRVRVEITVHTSGAVIDARVVTSSGHPLLDEAALVSARQWRFAPIERTDKAVIPFRYQR